MELFGLGIATGILLMVLVSGSIGWYLGRHPKVLVRRIMRGK